MWMWVEELFQLFKMSDQSAARVENQSEVRANRHSGVIQKHLGRELRVSTSHGDSIAPVLFSESTPVA